MLKKHEANDLDFLSSKSCTTVGFFDVKASNEYLVSEGNDTDGNDQERTVQIKILDVLYNNKLSSLVYIRDTTNLFKK